MEGHYNVLFLCTETRLLGRSWPQAIMNHKGREAFKAYSAGSLVIALAICALAAACGAQCSQDTDDLVKRIFHSMDEFSKGHQTDDATLAVVRVI